MAVSFKGIGERVLSFKTASAINAGSLVKMSANGTVAACAENDKFIGVVLSCRNNIAAVQIGGYVKVGYSGTAPTVGYNQLCAKSGTAVEVDAANGRALLVLDVDTTASTAGILL